MKMMRSASANLLRNPVRIIEDEAHRKLAHECSRVQASYDH